MRIARPHTSDALQDPLDSARSSVHSTLRASYADPVSSTTRANVVGLGLTGHAPPHHAATVLRMSQLRPNHTLPSTPRAGCDPNPSRAASPAASAASPAAVAGRPLWPAACFIIFFMSITGTGRAIPWRLLGATAADDHAGRTRRAGRAPMSSLCRITESARRSRSAAS